MDLNQDNQALAAEGAETRKTKPSVVIATASALAFVAGMGVSWLVRGRRYSREMQELRDQLDQVRKAPEPDAGAEAVAG